MDTLIPWLKFLLCGAFIAFAGPVTVANAPNIAVGDVLGSCVFNPLMLALIDPLTRDEPLYNCIDQGHILTAGFGVILIGATGAFLLLGNGGTSRPRTPSRRLPAP